MNDTQDEILFNVDPDGVGVLTLNRPEKLNAFGPAMLDRWHSILTAAQSDDAVRVIVVTGAGRAFCAGGDVTGMVERSELDSVSRKNYLWSHMHRIALDLERSDKPVIAAVNGVARGGGLDMALMCDLRIAATSATFAESYITMGLIAGDGGTYFLPRLVGVPRALELFWTGRTVSADEAERIGLVNRTVPDPELMTTTLALARKIAAQPQDAVRMFKRTVYQGLRMSLSTHLDMVSSHVSVLRGSADHRERVAALAERLKGGKSSRGQNP